MIKLNVGGVRFVTAKETLRGPYFERMFGETMTPGQLDAEGCWFIDRNGQLFGHVLDYLRNLERFVPPDSVDLAGLLNEALYFQLDGLVDLLRPCLCDDAFELYYEQGECGELLHLDFCESTTPAPIVRYLASLASDPVAAKFGSVHVKEPYKTSYMLQRIVQIAAKNGFELTSHRNAVQKNAIIALFSFDRSLYIRERTRQLLP